MPTMKGHAGSPAMRRDMTDQCALRGAGNDLEQDVAAGAHEGQRLVADDMKCRRANVPGDGEAEKLVVRRPAGGDPQP